MNIHIQKSLVNLYVQGCKRISVLHHERFIRILYCLIHNIAFYIPAVNIIIFKISVTS